MTVVRDKISDQTLADRVRRRLDESGYAAMRAVRCHVEAGRVELTGSARTYYLKQMAQELVRTMPGVDELRNDIRVGG